MDRARYALAKGDTERYDSLVANARALRAAHAGPERVEAVALKPVLTLTDEGRRTWIAFPYDKNVVDTVRDSGAHWDKTPKRWWVSNKKREKFEELDAQLAETVKDKKRQKESGISESVAGGQNIYRKVDGKWLVQSKHFKLGETTTVTKRDGSTEDVIVDSTYETSDGILYAHTHRPEAAQERTTYPRAPRRLSKRELRHQEAEERGETVFELNDWGGENLRQGFSNVAYRRDGSTWWITGSDDVREYIPSEQEWVTTEIQYARSATPAEIAEEKAFATQVKERLTREHDAAEERRESSYV